MVYMLELSGVEVQEFSMYTTHEWASSLEKRWFIKYLIYSKINKSNLKSLAIVT